MVIEHYIPNCFTIDEEFSPDIVYTKKQLFNIERVKRKVDDGYTICISRPSIHPLQAELMAHKGNKWRVIGIVRRPISILRLLIMLPIWENIRGF